MIECIVLSLGFAESGKNVSSNSHTSCLSTLKSFKLNLKNVMQLNNLYFTNKFYFLT